MPDRGLTPKRKRVAIALIHGGLVVLFIAPYRGPILGLIILAGTLNGALLLARTH